MENWNCPKHGSTDFGFAFVCKHLSLETGVGFHIVPDNAADEVEPRPPALCYVCEGKRKQNGGYETSRICAICYDEIKSRYSAQ